MKPLLLLFLATLCATASPLTDAVDDLIDRSVPLIQTAELNTALKAKKKPILLDARQPEEFRTSHIPGAYWIGYEKFKIANLPKVPKNTPIIVYCSVGYRSEKIGEKLKAAGYTNVRNLYGGIFAWANADYPLEDRNGKTTETVHGYDKNWSKLLDSDVPRVLETAQ